MSCVIHPNEVNEGALGPLILGRRVPFLVGTLGYSYPLITEVGFHYWVGPREIDTIYMEYIRGTVRDTISIRFILS